MARPRWRCDLSGYFFGKIQIIQKKICNCKKLYITLPKHIACRSPIWACGRGAKTYYLIAFIKRNLGFSESRKFYIGVENVATIDVFRV